MSAETIASPTQTSAPTAPAPASTTAPESSQSAVLRGVLGCTAVLLLWLVLFATVFSGVQESRSQVTLYASFRQALAEGTAPLSAPIAPGTPVATLTIRDAGLERAVVVQGTSAKELAQGPGHRPDTVLPGQVGRSVLYGRSLSYGGAFHDIPSLANGTKIDVVTGQGSFVYSVTGVRRAGDTAALPAAGTGVLTLVTSEGRGFGGRFSPSRTVFVDAVLDKPVEAGPVSAATRDEAPMEGSTDGLVVLVLWLEGLVLAGVAVVWAAHRWGRPQAWIVGTPLVAAVLWATTNSAWLLLPNLY